MSGKKKGAAATAPNCSNANGFDQQRSKDTKKKRYRRPESIKILEAKVLTAKQKAYPTFPPSYIPKTSYRDDTSNGLTKAIIDWLQVEGWQAERINSTGIQKRIKGNLKWIPTQGRKGTADISATIKGQSIKIEVKCAASGDRYQSSYQIAYQKEIEAAGGVYFIARDFTGFLEWYFDFVR